MRALLAAFALSLSACAASAAEVEYTMYQSAKGVPLHELKEKGVPFSPLWHAPNVKVLDLDAAKASHKFLGLGVSFAEASCKILSELPADERERILRMLWTKEGVNLSMGRIHVGCSDYSAHVYTYDDVEDDVELKHFSIDDDRRYVLPIIKRSLVLNPDLYCFSSIWTPPAWMKLNRELCGGWIDARKLPVLCDYYVKFLRAYRAEGIDVKALTVQNEPYSDQDGESADCKMGPNEEMEVVGRLLPPRLAAAGLKTEIWLRDSEPTDWQQTLWELKDPEVRKHTAAIAWHSYNGDPWKMRKVRAVHPEIPMYHTEMGPHLDYERRSLLWWGATVTKYLNAGCGSFVSWCPVLDEQGRPNCSRGFNCAGLVEVHSETRAVRPSNQYHFFRHVGPFVERGADVLENLDDNSTVTTFRNPDGSFVIVAVNASTSIDKKMQLQVKFKGSYKSFELLHATVTTIVLR